LTTFYGLNNFEATLLKPASAEDVLATAWFLALKIGMGGTALAWQPLARLAREGNVSGIEEWIEMCCTESSDYERTLRWVEENLHRLNLSLLKRFAGLAANRFVCISAD